jgi:hypothetical protein
METVKYPKGTTQEQWERYEAELAAHNQYIDRYRFFLNRICNHLEWKEKGKSWTPDEIRKLMTSEIDMSESCDAPNKPGYYRANND